MDKAKSFGGLIIKSVLIFAALVIIAWLLGALGLAWALMHWEEEQITYMGSLEIGESSGPHVLEDSNDLHIYTLEGTTGQAIRIVVAAGTDTYMQITLRREGEYQSIAYEFETPAYTYNSLIDLEATLPDDDTYEIVVYGSGKNIDYTIAVEEQLFNTKRLVFSSDMMGNLDLFISDIDGTNLVQVTETSDLDTQPDWSPNGHQIVFVRRSSPDDHADLFILDVDTLVASPITDQPLNETTPAWSPNGRYIAFTSDRDGGNNIYILDMQSGDTVQLISTPGFDTAPAWSPDGEELLYVSGGDLYTVDFNCFRMPMCKTYCNARYYWMDMEWTLVSRWLPYHVFR
jgi:hypothetical protein